MLHSFGKGTDGGDPSAALINVGDTTLYGTTTLGGANSLHGLFANAMTRHR